MDQTLLAMSILPGKTKAARAFLRDRPGPHKHQIAASDHQGLGIVHETGVIQSTPQSDLLLGYLAGEDRGRTLTQFSASQDAFDRWLKQQLLDALSGP